MRDNELRDFSHVGKPHDTLEDLARQHAGLKSYIQRFTEHGYRRCPRLCGHRLTVVSSKLRSLIVDNTAIDGVLGRHWGANTERIMLFDQAYNARTNNAAYRELLREYKQSVANADRVSLADVSLKDSIKKLESRYSFVRYNDAIALNFETVRLLRVTCKASRLCLKTCFFSQLVFVYKISIDTST